MRIDTTTQQKDLVISGVRRKPFDERDTRIPVHSERLLHSRLD